MKRIFLLTILCLCGFLSASAQNYNPWGYEYIPVDYDFEQNGIYYKFAPAPDGSFIDTSYYDSDGNLVKDGVYTGMEKDEGDILWVTAKEYIKEMGWIYYIDRVPDHYELTRNDTYSGDVYIPDSVEYEGKKYAVKGICADAFHYSNYNYGHIQNLIKSLRLPNTLVYIDDYAFTMYTPWPINEYPSSVKYIGKESYKPGIKLHDNVLTLKSQTLISSAKFYYPQNAVYAGQVAGSYGKENIEIVYPSQMRHLIMGDNTSYRDKIVIPDNGEFYVHQYGLPKNVSTIFSYAPIMKNCRPGYGFMLRYKDTDILTEKTLYVLTGLKEAYSKEWPELLTGHKYSVYENDKYVDYYLEEDHIIEVSREEMDAMVEAAGLTVPTAVSEVEVNPSKKVDESVFTLDGRRWSTLQKGVNIVRQSEGSTKKVYVK